MKPLRILMAGQVYVDGSGQGGFTLRLAENLAKQGHQVKMLMPSDRLTSYSVGINGVQVEKVAAVHMSVLHPAVYVTPLPALRVKKLFSEFAPDIVHIQDHYFLSAAVAREARKRNIPILGTNHFLPENIIPFWVQYPTLFNLAGRVLWKMMLDVYNQVDAATTPSHAAAEILREQDIQFPVHVISNGLNIERFKADTTIDRKGIRRAYGLTPNKTVFLYVGRLDGEKRVDILLQAASKLLREDFQLVIAGSGVQGQALRHQAHQLGLKDRVIFLGYVPATDLSSLYASADIFVMPSSAELQSIATMEALACGKPVLAANARALPELVTHAENGYLFAPNDADDAARWMKHFLDNPQKWADMGIAGIKHIQAHGLEHTIKLYEKQYRVVIEKHTGKQQKTPAIKGFKLFESYPLKNIFKSQ